ncbi:ATP-binding protein [Celeribacter halophilus]|uniref:histidine kinase n=1 Tax=Celeribacter halophilus TaxID=576117 RepID=A0A1I3PR92_9RHOB|nr:ATP-binding protein [Celeribacter halophilus]PZX13891.1 Hpt domain-containing protein [Celeribacter halophilus]SFJ24098.1 Hpt domain-containing protein [Celeribacter halophilus]
MTTPPDDRVSRRRYEREQLARTEAEKLLEDKSRELFEANAALSTQSANLERAVKERTEELEQALKRAEAASTARSRFIATMSHEIRTPLGGLLGMIDLLSMDEKDASKLELLNYAKAAGEGLSRIVNDVLDFSKMEAGVFVFEEEDVDIRALVESIRILYTSHGKGTGRTIVTKIDQSVPKLFRSDATRIRQIISNLINNALRYSADGPIIFRAKAEAHEKGVLLRCEVEDFGVGIPPEKFKDLFKDFAQVANPLTVAAQGTGLGLAICKRILDGLGGEVGVESSLGEGSTFWFEVPVEVVSRPQSTQDDDVEMASGGLSPARSIEGLRVLIAEDNIINQKMLLAYTDRMNLKADLAENGRIAVEKFAPGKYDLILMDIAMPEMDGIEATRQIKAKWPAKDVPPIFALTAHVADAIEEEANIVGIDRILSKPIPFDTLKSLIESSLKLSTAKAGGNPKVAEPSVAIPPVCAPKDASALVTELKGRMVPEVANHLLEIFDLDGLIDLVQKFVVDASFRLEQLIAAERSGDKDAASKQAHSLKGASLALGFKDMADMARHMELRDSDVDVEGLAEEFVSQVNEIRSILSL